MRRITVLVVASALAAAACGGGGGLDQDEQSAADALTLVFTADSSPNSPFTDEADAQCFAEGIVGEIGLGRMLEVGLTAEASSAEEAFGGLTAGEIDSLADVALGCMDVEALIVEQFALEGISEDSAKCLATAMQDTGLMKTAMIVGMTGDDSYDPTSDPELMEDILAAITDCLTFEEMSRLGG